MYIHTYIHIYQMINYDQLADDFTARRCKGDKTKLDRLQEPRPKGPWFDSVESSHCGATVTVYPTISPSGVNGFVWFCHNYSICIPEVSHNHPIIVPLFLGLAHYIHSTPGISRNHPALSRIARG